MTTLVWFFLCTCVIFDLFQVTDTLSIGGLESFEGSSYHIYCSQTMLSEIIANSRLHHDSLRESCSLPPLELDLERVTGVPDGYSFVDANGVELNLQLLHAPGHSPEHMVVLDLDESTIFLGDSAYEQSPLFYAYGGDLTLHIQTLARLEALLTTYESPEGARIWTAACGHFSSGLNAVSLLQRTKTFILDVIEEKVPSQSRETNPYQAGGVLEFFARDELAMACPGHLLQDAKSSSKPLCSS
jgi:glyoxylase-like metal-dependent hydrolase (beta-lactamase superfamily II)